MNLGEYIKSLPRDQRSAERARIAQACGVTESAVRHWCNGHRSISVDNAKTVVGLLEGKVTILGLLPGLSGGI